jgi:hypothetical protein
MFHSTIILLLATACHSSIPNPSIGGELAYYNNSTGLLCASTSESADKFFIHHYSGDIGPPLEDINIFQELEKSENEFLYLQSSEKVRALMKDLPEDHGILNDTMAVRPDNEHEARFVEYIRSQFYKDKVDGYKIRETHPGGSNIIYFNSDPSPSAGFSLPPLSQFHTDGNQAENL